MYMCWRCGDLFEEPVVYRDDPSPDGVSLPSGEYWELTCPRCGSSDIEKAEVCPSCGENHIDGGTLCMSCDNELIDALNRIRDSLGIDQDDFLAALTEYIER